MPSISMFHPCVYLYRYVVHTQVSCSQYSLPHIPTLNCARANTDHAKSRQNTILVQNLNEEFFVRTGKADKHKNVPSRLPSMTKISNKVN